MKRRKFNPEGKVVCASCLFCNGDDTCTAKGHRPITAREMYTLPPWCPFCPSPPGSSLLNIHRQSEVVLCGSTIL